MLFWYGLTVAASAWPRHAIATDCKKAGAGVAKVPTKRTPGQGAKALFCLEKSCSLPILNACTIAGRAHAISFLSGARPGRLCGAPGPARAARPARRSGTERPPLGASGHTANYHQSVQLSDAGAGHRPAHRAARATGHPGAPAVGALRFPLLPLNQEPVGPGSLSKPACAGFLLPARARPAPGIGPARLTTGFIYSIVAARRRARQCMRRPTGRLGTIRLLFIF